MRRPLSFFLVLFPLLVLVACEAKSPNAARSTAIAPTTGETSHQDRIDIDVPKLIRVDDPAGSIDPSTRTAVQRAVIASTPSLSRWYDMLGADTKRPGSVTVWTNIRANGRVASTTLESSDFMDPVGSCINIALRRITVPALVDGAVSAKVVLQFSPSPASSAGIDPAILLAERLERVLVARNEPLKACFDNAVQKNPTIWGMHDIDVSLGVGGVVSDVRVVGSLFSTPEFDTCVQREVEKLRFEGPELPERFRAGWFYSAPAQFVPIVSIPAELRPLSAASAPGGAPAVSASPTPPAAPSASAANPANVGPRTPPPRVVQLILRQRYRQFRSCYQEGLKRDPLLSGQVSMHFVIETNGKTSQVQARDVSLPDVSAVECLVKAFSETRFPKPSGGTVTVTYPISFSPGS
jgi:hypothetical protein